MISPDEYLQVLGSLAGPLPAERRSVGGAAGCVLAADVIARVPSPAFTNSAMDGFACRRAELETAGLPASFPVSADIPAGSAPAPLASGTVARIMTGAPVPEGADAIVPVEDTSIPAGPAELPTEVRIDILPRPGAHFRRRGEIMSAGDPVAFAGETVAPFSVGGILAAGVDEVDVLPTPRVLVVSTGAELTERAENTEGAEGSTSASATITDSNGPMLAALFRSWGAGEVHVAHADDTAEDLASTFAAYAGRADLVVTTGGVSAGAYDPLKMLADSGREGTDLHFLKVAQQPGKPQGYGTVGGVPIVMLPGNPVSAFVSAWLYARRVFCRLAGRPTDLAFVEGRMSADLGPFGGKRRFVPARLEDGEFSLLGADRGFSHAVSRMHRADALLVIEADTACAAGDTVRAIDLSAPLPE